jgi:hypothetical protein
VLLFLAAAQKTRLKKMRNGRGKQTEETKAKATFFVMSYEPRLFFLFLKQKKIVFLNSPCYETPKKAIKKIKKQ